MNYGKYFRLNQNISKIEEGVAIFDYIDLPAYFESSGDNLMSPKYPISVSITENNIIFRVHYSAYKTDESTYLYKIEEGFKDRQSDLKHMEEVILKLPYINDGVEELYQTIKDIYNTRYPLMIDKHTTLIYELIGERYKGNDGGSPIKNDLYKKLRESLDGDSSYSTLWLMDIVENVNEGNKIINLYGKDEQKVIVTKFLRKLLLDFMFDLKHSDVFQTSKYYESMYSGLMSNFYFSALMHKCEYYFYRVLVTDVIQKRISNIYLRKKHLCRLYAKELFEAEDLWMHDIMSPQAEKYFEHFYENEDDQEHKKNTLKDPDLWVAIKTELIKIWDGIKMDHKKERTRYSFRNWDSWFASPEEEMRRVCFTMKDKEGTSHICNAETVTEYLRIVPTKKETIPVKLNNELIRKKDSNKTEISKWFLKRYAFNDVFHLHLFKYASRLFFVTLTLLLLLLFLFPNFVSPNFWEEYNYAPIYGGILLLWLYAVWGTVMFVEYRNPSKHVDNRNLNFLKRLIVSKRNKTLAYTMLYGLLVIIVTNGIVELFTSDDNCEWIFITIAIIIQAILIPWGSYILYKKFYPLSFPRDQFLKYPRSRLVSNRVKAIIFTLLWALLIISTVNRGMNNICSWMLEESPRGTFVKIFVILTQAALILGGGYVIHKRIYPLHWLSNMHVFFPRLVASIAAAWLSLAIGNELFGTFFDSIVSWSTSIWLTLIVFIFVMYEINKLLPLETTYSKVKRCLGIIAISYAISLVAGLFIINFTGERFLERSGVLKDFYKQYIYNNNEKQVENKSYVLTPDRDHKFIGINDNKKFNTIVIKSAKDLEGVDTKEGKYYEFVDISEGTNDKLLLDELQHVHITGKTLSDKVNPKHPIVTIWNMSGTAKFFILRDFLIQFAFVAMFIGIFIQMLFEEKSITEV